MKVMKRDGCLVNFEISRIVKAVDKAFIAVEGVSRKEASRLARRLPRHRGDGAGECGGNSRYRC